MTSPDGGASGVRDAAQPVISDDPMTRLAVCEVTISPLDIDARIEAIANAGIPGFGPFRPIHEPDLDGLQLRHKLDAAGLRPSFGVPHPFSVRPMRPFDPVAGRHKLRGLPAEQAEEAIIADLRWLAEVGPAAVMVLAGAQGSDSRDEAWSRAGEAL